MSWSQNSIVGKDIPIPTIIEGVKASLRQCTVETNIITLLHKLGIKENSECELNGDPSTIFLSILLAWQKQKPTTTLQDLAIIFKESKMKAIHDAINRRISDNEKKPTVKNLHASPYENSVNRSGSYPVNNKTVIHFFLTINLIGVITFICWVLALLSEGRPTSTANMSIQEMARQPTLANYTTNESVCSISDKLQIFGQGALDRSAIAIQNQVDIQSITWHGCFDIRELLPLLRGAVNIRTIDLKNNCDKALKEPKSYRKKFDMTPIWLPNLLTLSLENFTATGVVEALRKGVVMGKLETLRLVESHLRTNDGKDVKELLTMNTNLKTLQFLKVDWEFWFFGLQLPVLPSLTELVIEFDVTSFSRTFHLEKLCETFPALETFKFSGDLLHHEIHNIMKCKNLKNLVVNLFIPRSSKAVGLGFLQSSSGHMENLEIFFEFENFGHGECQLTELSSTLSKYPFLTVRSNCQDMS